MTHDAQKTKQCQISRARLTDYLSIFKIIKKLIWTYIMI